MSIVQEAFRRLEAEREAPIAVLKCITRLTPPADLGRCTRHVYTQACGTLLDMERLLKRKALDYGAPVRRRRGQLRFDVYYHMAFERISYFVARVA